jgi:hypothetical protein
MSDHNVKQYSKTMGNGEWWWISHLDVMTYMFNIGISDISATMIYYGAIFSTTIPLEMNHGKLCDDRMVI